MFFKIVVALLSEGLRRARHRITIVTQVIHSQVVSPSERTINAFLDHSFSLSEFVVRSYSTSRRESSRRAPLGRLSRLIQGSLPCFTFRDARLGQLRVLGRPLGRGRAGVSSSGVGCDGVLEGLGP